NGYCKNHEKRAKNQAITDTRTERRTHLQQASLRYVFDPTQSTEVSSEAVSSSQGTVEPRGSIGALAGGRAIAQWNTAKFLKLCFDNCTEIGVKEKD
nr:zinc finger protein ZPR1-like [Tanacetum cinerariifolium]